MACLVTVQETDCVSSMMVNPRPWTASLVCGWCVCVHVCERENVRSERDRERERESAV